MKDKVKERAILDLVQNNKDIINFYLVSKEEKQKILEIISIAEDNKTEYVFPDFVLDNGFIEHFQITSSYTNRNGSYMEIKNAEINRAFEKKMIEVDEELSNGEKWIESFSIEPVLQDKQSYFNLIKSFKGNFENHLESLDKFTKKEKVDYIIFVNRSCVDGLYIEVIKTEKIIELVDILKDGYFFYPINLYTGKFSIGVKRFGDLC